ncbi:hypothetical protein BJ085DRAFT_27832 [Dimargaris cristalligena]|uniref:Uncharacterized protein n=1 Tax=Dimargaris cristalligena TaxID=215637 RepID=A0A4P9ZLI2_9FUNG|nr:hypothetical protein BJ085DRAFT_27832 [Dimargaris cristalligena]|eukprot:RKP34137.1 hypothetical protein BJ085DRAFT_27832 [Dimargaris cristalligena]
MGYGREGTRGKEQRRRIVPGLVLGSPFTEWKEERKEEGIQAAEESSSGQSILQRNEMIPRGGKTQQSTQTDTHTYITVASYLRYTSKASPTKTANDAVASFFVSGAEEPFLRESARWKNQRLEDNGRGGVRIEHRARPLFTSEVLWWYFHYVPPVFTYCPSPLVNLS